MVNYTKGQKIGNLTFINEDFHEKEVTGYQNYRMAVMECFCGRKFITRISAINYGKVKSCGCTRKDGLLKRITRHNMSNTSEYKSWESMKSRCLNSKNKFYYNYGGRGIKVCKEWLEFKNFFKDMGTKPNINDSLDRINVNDSYYKENCRWTSREVQDRNKTNSVYLNYKGKDIIMADLAKLVHINAQTIKARLDKGMTLDEAINKSYKYTKK